MPEIEVEMDEAPASTKSTSKGAKALFKSAFEALKDDDADGFARLMEAAVASCSYAEDD